VGGKAFCMHTNSRQSSIRPPSAFDFTSQIEGIFSLRIHALLTDSVFVATTTSHSDGLSYLRLCYLGTAGCTSLGSINQNEQDDLK